MKTKLMAILNCTPDSFYASSRNATLESAVVCGIKMHKEGADIIDIGGESTRPGALSVSIEEEIQRTIPVLEALKKEVSIPISIDTQKPEVFECALKKGVNFLNDVSGLKNTKMKELVKDSGLPFCVMHMQNDPLTMQNNPSYPRGVVTEIYEWFEKKIEELLAFGIKESQIYLDPGIGFGKSVQNNLDIIKNIEVFNQLKLPILIGLSRKSFMSKILNQPATELLSTTLALNTISVLAGVAIIRVHDVKEHRFILDLLHRYTGNVDS